MVMLPTGTVTFLFTDIEGSTKLAQEHPETRDNFVYLYNYSAPSTAQNIIIHFFTTYRPSSNLLSNNTS